MKSFRRLLTAAIRHFAKHGFHSTADVEAWKARLTGASDDPDDLKAAQDRVRRGLRGAFDRAVGSGAIRKHQGVPRWTIDRLEPALREELERRMYAAADLVKGDQKIAAERAVQKFIAYATGDQPEPMLDVIRDTSKAARDAANAERRVLMDQQRKMRGNLNDIIARGAGAIGGIWDATWEIERKHRPEHAERHDRFYPIRGSWADERNLTKRPWGYVDDHDLPGQLINCKCEMIYVYDIADVPPEMLSVAGERYAASAA